MHKVLAHLRKVRKNKDKEIREDISYQEEVGDKCLGWKWAKNRIKNNRVFVNQLDDAIKILNET